MKHYLWLGKKNTAAKHAILKDAVLFMNIVFPAAYILIR